MRQRGLRNLTYQFLLLAQLAAVFLGAMVPASHKIDLEATKINAPFLVPIVEWSQTNTWWFAAACAAVTAAAAKTKQLLGPPWVWKAIEAVFDRVRDTIFHTDDSDPTHHHRITLFQRVGFLAISAWSMKRGPWYWPWGAGRGPTSGWLLPVARSGHITKRSSPVFLAPDDADNAEGIAGQAYNQKGIIRVIGLPDLDHDPSEANIAEYAIKTWMPEEWVRKRLKDRKPFARSYCGVMIEVRGVVWGVIVLDSRMPDGIKGENKLQEAFTLIAPALSHLLART